MRAWLSALMNLLRQALAQTGWRQHQEGEGTQIGQVHGNVTIYQQAASIPAPTPQRHTDAPEDRLPQPSADDVQKLFDELEAFPANHAAVKAWMRSDLRTDCIERLQPLELRRAYAYMLTTYDNCLNERKREEQLAKAYRARRRKR